MLTDSIGNAFRFHLAGAFVRSALSFFGGSIQVNIVQLCVCNFVYRRFQCLQLTHTLVKRNSFVLKVIIAVCAARNLFKSNRNGRGLFKCGKKVLVIFHVAEQFICPKRRQFLSLGL